MPDTTRAERIAYFQKRSKITDAEYLHELAEQARAQALDTVKALQDAQAEEDRIMAYVREHGTDEG